MITEDYISFEIAKLLKEKGFDAPNLHGLDFDGENIWIKTTIQMAMKWLREVHNIDICIGKADIKAYTALIIKNNISYPYYPIKNKEKDTYQGFSLYEEACEAAIKYCLEYLI